MGEIKNALQQGVKYSGVSGILKIATRAPKQTIKKSRLAGRRIPFLKGATLKTLLEEESNC